MLTFKIATVLLEAFIIHYNDTILVHAHQNMNGVGENAGITAGG